MDELVARVRAAVDGERDVRDQLRRDRGDPPGVRARERRHPPPLSLGLDRLRHANPPAVRRPDRRALRALRRRADRGVQAGRGERRPRAAAAAPARGDAGRPDPRRDPARPPGAADRLHGRGGRAPRHPPPRGPASRAVPPEPRDERRSRARRPAPAAARPRRWTPKRIVSPGADRRRGRRRRDLRPSPGGATCRPTSRRTTRTSRAASRRSAPGSRATWPRCSSTTTRTSRRGISS